MESPKTIEHEIGGVKNDALRFGLHGVKSDIVGSHPLESEYQSTRMRQEDMKRKILVNTYGSAFPLRMELDRQILSRKTMEAAKKQNRGFEDSKNGSADELKAVGEEISTLKTKIKKLESECETKDKEVKAAESNSLAFKNQSAGFLLEYDHLLEENQNLRNQLQSIDQSLPHSDGKKNM
ncbi:unnamed protein product [Ilex paraguariensis]|uniref:Endoplasmic reticulum transmembrane protein n=1 Tax=Ilex paraguariensis TaxID=185542 RepID=A0ABC8UC03_9AQUA